MSNLGLERALGSMGIGFERTDVGDRYVMERLKERNWVLGGEPSGHIICLDRTTTGDGIVTALQVVTELRKSGRTLKELRQGMEKYPQLLQNVRLGDRVAAEIMSSETLTAAVRAVQAELGDKGRVLLRPSGTEPLIRVMIEGQSGNQVEALTRQLVDVVEELRA